MSAIKTNSAETLEGASLLTEHIRLKERFNTHLEEYDRHRKELCEDYKTNLEFTKEVGKNATLALEVATKNAEATAVLVEGVTTLQSIKKFVKWSGSSAVLIAAVTWLIAHIPELLGI